MFEWLDFTKTGYAFFDVWSLVHLSFWFFVGSNIWAFTNRHAHEEGVRTLLIGLSVLGALLWEVFERYAEEEWPNVWLSPESWWNAWVSDLLTCVVGIWLVLFLLNRFGVKK